MSKFDSKASKGPNRLLYAALSLEDKFKSLIFPIFEKVQVLLSFALVFLLITCGGGLSFASKTVNIWKVSVFIFQGSQKSTIYFLCPDYPIRFCLTHTIHFKERLKLYREDASCFFSKSCFYRFVHKSKSFVTASLVSYFCLQFDFLKAFFAIYKLSKELETSDPYYVNHSMKILVISLKS